jgi:hypothetical protein
MRTAALLRPAMLVLLAGAVSAGCARPAARSTAATPEGAAAVGAAGEEARAHALADALRGRILASAEFTEFPDDCHPGTLRTFPKDTPQAARARTEELVERLERLVVVQGVENTLDSPAAHDLLRTVVLWEAGGLRPRWDVARGGEDRRAIAPGLVGEFRNPATAKCESYVAADTATVVIPEVADFRAPSVQGVRLSLYMGEAGLKQARDAFFAKQGASDPNSLFTYTRVRAAVVWGDYAVVAVNRPAESRGIQPLSAGAGGASYVFHRVGEEWRLLTIVRSWG